MDELTLREEQLQLLLFESDAAEARRLAYGLVDAGWVVDIVRGFEQAAFMTARKDYDAALLGPSFAHDPSAFVEARRMLPQTPIVDVHGPTARQRRAMEVVDGLPIPVLSFDVRPGGATLEHLNRAAAAFLRRDPAGLLADPASIWGHVHHEDLEDLLALTAGDETSGPRTIRWVADEGEIVSCEVAAGVRRDDAGAVTAVELLLLDARPTLQPPLAERARADLPALADVVAVIDVDHAPEVAEVAEVADVSDEPAAADEPVGTAEPSAAVESSASIEASASDDVDADPVDDGVLTLDLDDTSEELDEARFHLRLWPRLAFVWVDQATPEVLGLDPDAMTADAATFFDAIEPRMLPDVERALQAAVGGPTTVRFVVRASVGDVRSLELTLAPLPGDHADGVILEGVARDVIADVAASFDEATSADAPVAAPAATHEAVAVVREVELQQLVRKVVEGVDLGARSVTIEAEPTSLRADVTALTEALEAALDNIREHTPPRTNVELTIARATGGALLTIRDNGPGMVWPAGHRARWHGLANAADLAEVAGRGMAALARVAERHDGRTTIQAMPGQGTVVRVLLHEVADVPDAPSVDDAPATGQALAGRDDLHTASA